MGHGNPGRGRENKANAASKKHGDKESCRVSEGRNVSDNFVIRGGVARISVAVLYGRELVPEARPSKVRPEQAQALTYVRQRGLGAQ